MKIDVKPRSFFTIKSINLVVRVLVLSDLVVISSYGLISPIFAIFIVDSISGGNIAAVGIASAVYLLTKSLFQIPIALVIDSTKGEKDDFWAMFIGSTIFSLMPLFYLFIDSLVGLYIIQAIYGLAMAAAQPSYNAIWVRHIDRGHEAVESGVYNTFIGLGSALTASLGGFIAMNYGFSFLFILVSITSLIGSFFLLIIYNNMKTGPVIIPKKEKKS